MIYDTHPPYAHHSHLRFAHEPYKLLYVLTTLTTTLLLVPLWALTYAVLPRRARPRGSWTLRQIVQVNFTRRIFRVTERAGVTWGTRNPGEEPREEGRETRFVWVDGVEEGDLKKGVLCYGGVESGRVGCFVWPKEPKRLMRSASRGQLDSSASPPDRKPVVGIFMHGGGYCHMSAHESSRASRIPRQLIKRNLVDEIYSVEYRLLQHAPFPAALQDAVAVYAHVVRKLYDPAKCTLLLIGDSSGGNLVLALARWIRDEGVLPMPHGLLLLSPSCDPSHALPETLARIPSYRHTPRPNERSDYLVDTPEPRALLHRTFLGFSSSQRGKRFRFRERESGRRGRLDEEQGIERARERGSERERERGEGEGEREGEEEMEEDDERELARLRRIVHSEYVSPCSPLVLRRWGHQVVQDGDRDGEQGGEGDHPDASSAGWHDDQYDDDDILPHLYTRTPNSVDDPKSTAHTLFGGFPRTLVVCGDAERLTREVMALVRAMRRDCRLSGGGGEDSSSGGGDSSSSVGVEGNGNGNVEQSGPENEHENENENKPKNKPNPQNEHEQHVQLCWARDACHDVLIMPEEGWWVWDRAVLEEVWGALGRWVKGF